MTKFPSHMVPIWANTQPCQKWADPEQGEGSEHFIRGQPGENMRTPFTKVLVSIHL